jgi:cell division protein FtsL
MLRFVNICLVLGLVALAYVIYQVKYEAHGLDERIVVLNKQIDEERDSLAVLRAEWSLLNRPDRIERLAKKYLKLAPAAPQQLVILDDVTDRDFGRDVAAAFATPAQPVKTAPLKAASN